MRQATARIFGTSYLVRIPADAFSASMDVTVVDALGDQYRNEVSAYFGECDPRVSHAMFLSLLTVRMRDAGNWLLAERTSFRSENYFPSTLATAHRILFEGMASHAGRFRGIALGRRATAEKLGPRDMFVRPDFFDEILQELLPKIGRNISTTTHDELPRALAMAYSDFNVVHPFVDGNGRMNFLLLDTLLNTRSLRLDFSKVPRAILARAAYGAAIGQIDPLAALFRATLVSKSPS